MVVGDRFMIVELSENVWIWYLELADGTEFCHSSQTYTSEEYARRAVTEEYLRAGSGNPIVVESLADGGDSE